MYYCRQVPPDMQDSDVWGSEIYGNIFVEGTSRYKSHGEKSMTGKAYAEVEKCLRDARNEMDEAGVYCTNAFQASEEQISQVFEIIQRTIPRSDGSKYSDKELIELAGLLRYKWSGFDEEYQWSLYSDKKAIARVMSLMNPGHEYTSKTIYGSVQGEYNIIFYDAKEYTDQDIDIFECEYFNTGTEWMVLDEDVDELPDDTDDMDEYSVYCHEWNIEKIRAELANAIGTKPENVVLLEFERYEKLAVYKQNKM